MRSGATSSIQARPVVHSTFVIERSYPAPAERVFEAFANPAKKRRWFVEAEGHDVQEFEMDFRVGGTERARFRFTGDSPVQGLACTNQAIYQDIVPNRRLVMASTMNIAGRCISASLVTVELVEKDTGTDLVLTHQGAFFEGADGPGMREAGWRQLLDRFEQEVAR